MKHQVRVCTSEDLDSMLHLRSWPRALAFRAALTTFVSSRKILGKQTVRLRSLLLHTAVPWYKKDFRNFHEQEQEQVIVI